MHLKRRRTDHPKHSQSCRCGWSGSTKQLGVWLRKDQVISQICPQCGTPKPISAAQRMAFQGQPSRMIH